MAISNTQLQSNNLLYEQNLNNAKNEFVTLTSHQLRTPISAIKWFTEMLLQGDAGHLGSNQREYIQQIHTTNTRLSAIVDNLLLASSLQTQTITVHPEPTDLPDLCRSALANQLHIQKENKGLKVTQKYPNGFQKVLLDPSLIRIVLSNLFSNAIKYTPPGGTVKISLTNSSEKLRPDSQGTIQLQVTDNGYGIPKKEQQKIFAKLYRASNIKDKDTDGTGLGLYIVKEILEQTGGRISFSSAQNTGSTFTVLLPMEGMKHQITSTEGQNA